MPGVSPPVAEVVVYTDRALVTRRGSVAVVAGAQELVLSGLSPNLLVDSVRAGGRGPMAVRITGLEVRATFHTESVVVERRLLEEELEGLRDRDARLAEQVAVIENGRAFVQDLQRLAAPDMARALARKRVDLSDCQNLLDFARTRTAEAQAELAGLVAQRRLLAAEIAAVQERLHASGGGSPRRAYDLVVGIQAANVGEWELEVDYVVTGARWLPRYDLHVRNTPEGPRVGIGYFALVSQTTGEEWPDVALTLSTARPSLGTLPPKLTPWYVDLSRPPVRPAPFRARMARSAPDGPPEPVDDSAPAALIADMSLPAPPGQPKVEALMDQAIVEGAGATVSYRLPDRAGVPADGAPHKVAVADADLPADFTYESVPRLLPYVYLRAEVRNTSGLLFLPGEASVFQDGRFVGGISLPDAVAPQQEFTLSLGVDEGIRVERDLTRRAVDKTLIGGNRRISSSYRVVVTNTYAREAHVTLRDQIPVSRHEQLKVKVGRCEPQPAEQTGLGELRWELTVPPGATRECLFDLTVEYPAAETPIGL